MPDLPNLANLDYVGRVNRAIDHITRNLAEPLDLKDVARVACFSPYHFHRIFQGLVGETIAAFIKRVRLQRAIFLLAHRKGASLTEIALSCGFSSSSDFSRSFRKAFGVPPSVFDVERFCSSGREQMQDALTPPEARHLLQRLPPGENPDGFVVRFRDLPQRRVAYIRVHRPYEGKGVLDAVERLMAWARARGLQGGQWLGYQWENPEIVPLEQCRYDVGLEIPGDVDLDAGISETTFPPMKVAELDIAGPIDVEMRALDWLYGTWFPTSGYAPAHQPGFEAWNGEPFAHGMEHFELRIQLAVVDASAPL
jgi:AraC family transcriptional regulator